MDDDVQLTAVEAAELAGGIKPDTWYAYVHRGYAPAPDGKLGRTPWWWKSTIVAWLATRAGQGARTDLFAPEWPTGRR